MTVFFFPSNYYLIIDCPLKGKKWEKKIYLGWEEIAENKSSNKVT